MGVAEPAGEWRLRTAAGVKLCPFDDGVAAFDLAAWETHLLDERAAIVLELLAAGPRSGAAITQVLADRAQCDPREAVPLAQAALAELAAAGLVAGPALDAPG